MTDIAPPTLQALRVRICRILPAQVRAAVEPLTDEEIWWRPNASSNSIGNLILHLSGSLNHYLNRNIGAINYDRDRAAEFAAEGPIPKQTLMSAFDEMVTRAEQTFDGLDAARLGGPSSDPPRATYLIEDLISIVTHLSTHTGQVLWIAKSLREGGFDEVWIRTHKRLGGWKQA